MTGPYRWPLPTRCQYLSLSPSCDTRSPAICRCPAGNHFWLQQTHLGAGEGPSGNQPFVLEVDTCSPLISLALWALIVYIPQGKEMA